MPRKPFDPDLDDDEDLELEEDEDEDDRDDDIDTAPNTKPTLASVKTTLGPRGRNMSATCDVDSWDPHADADWDESMHPRGENGQFGSGGGGGASSTEARAGNATHEMHENRIGREEKSHNASQSARNASEKANAHKSYDLHLKAADAHREAAKAAHESGSKAGKIVAGVHASKAAEHEATASEVVGRTEQGSPLTYNRSGEASATHGTYMHATTGPNGSDKSNIVHYVPRGAESGTTIGSFSTARQAEAASQEHHNLAAHEMAGEHSRASAEQAVAYKQGVAAHTASGAANSRDPEALLAASKEHAAAGRAYVQANNNEAAQLHEELATQLGRQSRNAATGNARLAGAKAAEATGNRNPDRAKGEHEAAAEAHKIAMKLHAGAGNHTSADEHKTQMNAHSASAKAEKLAAKAAKNSPASIDRELNAKSAAEAHRSASTAHYNAGNSMQAEEHTRRANELEQKASQAAQRPSRQADVIKQQIESKSPGTQVTISPLSSAGGHSITVTHPASGASHTYGVSKYGVTPGTANYGSAYMTDPRNGRSVSSGRDHFEKTMKAAINKAKKVDTLDSVEWEELLERDVVEDDVDAHDFGVDTNVDDPDFI